MRKHLDSFATRTSVLAVQGALIAMTMVPVAALADDEADLRQTTSSIEVGVDSVDKGSYKFGEYNGLHEKGATAVGNVDLRGGSFDNPDGLRWRIRGTDLGLETRNLSAEFANQGSFRLTFGWDELLRNRSDSYQTPYQGEGGSNFTLPANWLKPVVPQVSTTGVNFRSFDPVAGTANALASGVTVVPTAANLATLAAISSADVGDFHHVDLHTKRSKYDVGFSANLAANWEVKGSFSHERKDGFKPMSVVTSQVSEFAATLADPIDQVHEQYNLSVNYADVQQFLTVGYYASMFRNDVKQVTWQDAMDLTKNATYASAPENQFHQLKAVGGYNFSRTTKLVVDAAYGRNTQNQSFVTDGQNAQFPLGLPDASLHGLVVTKSLSLKLTTKPMKDLGLAAGYKFDDRDNQTPVNTYFFQDANEAKSGTNSFLAGQGSNLNMYANRPYSKKLNQFNLDASYNLAKGQMLKAGWDFQKIDRKCNGSWINCADAPTTKENTFKGEWKGNLGDGLDARLAYDYAQRKVNYDEDAFLALTPYANVVPTLGAAISGTTKASMSAYQYLLSTGLTGFGPVAGFPATALTGDALIFSPSNGVVPNALYGSRNVISELVGMRRFNMADRDRNALRAVLNWQANEQWSWRASYAYTDDDYKNSVYGLKSSKKNSFNLDGTLALSEDFTATAFVTLEDQRSKSAGDAFGSSNNGLTTNSYVGNAANVNVSPAVCFGTVAAKNINAKTDPCLNWYDDMRDKVTTFGLSFKQKGLMAGRLTVNGDLVFSHARSTIDVSGGSYVNNPLAAAGAQAGGVGAFYIAAAGLPTVATDTTTVRLGGKYELDKASALHVGYSYTRMKATDYAYEGMQFGTGTNYMPTLETAPNFTVQAVGVSYLHRFN